MDIDVRCVSLSHLDAPTTLVQRVQAKLIGDLGRCHRIGQILLVGEDQQTRITKLVLVEHSAETSVT